MNYIKLKDITFSVNRIKWFMVIPAYFNEIFGRQYCTKLKIKFFNECSPVSIDFETDNEAYSIKKEIDDAIDDAKPESK